MKLFLKSFEINCLFHLFVGFRILWVLLLLISLKHCDFLVLILRLRLSFRIIQLQELFEVHLEV